MTSCWARFDAWYWGDETLVTRCEKRCNILKQSGNSDNTTLRNFRYLHCFWFLANEATSVYQDGLNIEDKWKFKTDWGWYIYGLYTIVAAYAHFKHDGAGKPPLKDSTSPFNLWKIVTALFELVTVDHLIIMIFYWGLVHWGLDPPHSYWRIMKHSAPFPLMLIEMYLNKIVVEFRHIW